MKNKKISPELWEFIEANADLEPKDLLLKLENHFGETCAGSNCFCAALDYILNLYRDTNRLELPATMHERLIACLNQKTNTSF